MCEGLDWILESRGSGGTDGRGEEEGSGRAGQRPPGNLLSLHLRGPAGDEAAAAAAAGEAAAAAASILSAVSSHSIGNYYFIDLTAGTLLYILYNDNKTYQPICQTREEGGGVREEGRGRRPAIEGVEPASEGGACLRGGGTTSPWGLADRQGSHFTFSAGEIYNFMSLRAAGSRCGPECLLTTEPTDRLTPPPQIPHPAPTHQAPPPSQSRLHRRSSRAQN